MTAIFMRQAVTSTTGSSNSFTIKIGPYPSGSKLTALAAFPTDANLGPIFFAVNFGDFNIDQTVRLAQGFCRQDGSNLSVDSVHWDGSVPVDTGLPILRGFANNNTGTSTTVLMSWAVFVP